MVKPTLDQYQNQKRYECQDFSSKELDIIYSCLSAEIRQEVGAWTTMALARRNFANVRPGSNTWLKVQRMILLSKLWEAQDLVRDAELGDEIEMPTT